MLWRNSKTVPWLRRCSSWLSNCFQIATRRTENVVAFLTLDCPPFYALRYLINNLSGLITYNLFENVLLSYILRNNFQLQNFEISLKDVRKLWFNKIRLSTYGTLGIAIVVFHLNRLICNELIFFRLYCPWFCSNWSCYLNFLLELLLI